MIFSYHVMGIVLRWKILNYLLEIDILRTKTFGCRDFSEVWGSKSRRDTVLAKNMLHTC